MSTLAPRPPYSDAELAALYPPQLRLQQVQVLLRHGERTPVKKRFAKTGLPAFWPYCSAVRQLRSVLSDGHNFSVLEWKRRLETIRPDGVPATASGPGGEVDNICDLGMLTDRGRETTFQLGQRLRRLYVDQLGFLPAGVNATTDFLYLRATAVPRALESLQQTFHGLYPSHTRGPDFCPPTIVSRALPEETLLPNFTHCRRFDVISRAFAQRAADRWNGSPEMDYLSKKLGKWMPEGNARLAVDSHPRLSGVMDTINASLAHGPETRLPDEFYDPKVRQFLDKIVSEEWYAGFAESHEYRTLGIGGLMGDIVARMVESVEGPPSSSSSPSSPNPGKQQQAIRLSLSGCHDTTIAGTLASLGAFPNPSWPPFTSHIAIELFQRTSISGADSSSSQSSSPPWWSSLFGSSPSSGSIGRKLSPELSENEKKRLQGYFVRVRYNDRPVTIPGCKPSGKHLDGDESFCTLVSISFFPH